MKIAALIWNVARASTDNFGSCNYTDFVEEAVGGCEKEFYIDLAQDLTANCRTCYSRLEDCFVKKTRKCLEGHYGEAQLNHAVNVTLLLQSAMSASQWYCSNKPMNLSSLDPKLRKLIPCTDELFKEGHNCARGFREIFNANRNDPSLCQAFSNSRACARSVFDRYCTISVPVPTQNHLNPFCHDRDFNQSKEPKVDFQASKRSINETETASQPNQPVPNRAHKTSRALSRMLSVAVSVVNLTTAAWKLGLN